MKKEVWGPCIWKTLHVLTVKIKEEYFSTQRQKLIDIIFQICNNLPCPMCASHAQGLLRKYRPAMFKNDYLKCSHVYKSGKKKNCPCENHGQKFKNGIFCYRHKRQQDMKQVFEINVCSATLKSGKPCSCKVFDSESQLCKRHLNLRNKELNK